MPAQKFLIPESSPGPELQKIRTFAEGLQAGGGTAIYASLTTAYATAKTQVAQDRNRFTSIVLMTDGENANGIGFPDFKAALPQVQVKGVPIFPILFGTARETEMNEIAQLTGGRAFDARTQPLADVFKRRRGVCQDFAHLMIGCLRALGLPARYVSGYLLTTPATGTPRLVGADASHAWVSVWCPDGGWVDFDPTNDTRPQLSHVTLAWGRDFGDVSPLRGIILGGGEHELAVRVTVTPQS
jgi:hypothetical protein